MSHGHPTDVCNSDIAKMFAYIVATSANQRELRQKFYASPAPESDPEWVEITPAFAHSFPEDFPDFSKPSPFFGLHCVKINTELLFCSYLPAGSLRTENCLTYFS